MKKSKNNRQKLESNPPTNDVIGRNPAREVIKNEIECPRCYDMMTLCSDFDNLYYVCESCDFYLYTLSDKIYRRITYAYC